MADIAAGSAPASGSASGSPSSVPASATQTQDSGTTGQGQVSGQPTGQSGEPPRERWNSILNSAREKERQAVEAKWQQRFQPFEAFERDPWAAVQEWLGRAEKHSLYGDKVKAWIGQRNQPAKVTEEPAPDVPIVDQNGNVVDRTYSARQLKEWQKWNDVQAQARFDERLSPIEQRAREQQEREESAKLWESATNGAKETLSDLRALPYFKEHEHVVRQSLIDHPEWGDNVHRAFNHVMMTQILPNLSQAEQRSVIKDLQQQGAASTVSPGSTTVGTPKFRSFATAAAYYADHPDEAAAMAGKR